MNETPKLSTIHIVIHNKKTTTINLNTKVAGVSSRVLQVTGVLQVAGVNSRGVTVVLQMTGVCGVRRMRIAITPLNHILQFKVNLILIVHSPVFLKELYFLLLILRPDNHRGFSTDLTPIRQRKEGLCSYITEWVIINP